MSQPSEVPKRPRIADEGSYLDTAKRALSAAIRELASAEVFLGRADQTNSAGTAHRLWAEARALRAALEER